MQENSNEILAIQRSLSDYEGTLLVAHRVSHMTLLTVHVPTILLLVAHMSLVTCYSAEVYKDGCSTETFSKNSHTKNIFLGKWCQFDYFKFIK